MYAGYVHIYQLLVRKEAIFWPEDGTPRGVPFPFHCWPVPALWENIRESCWKEGLPGMLGREVSHLVHLPGTPPGVYGTLQAPVCTAPSSSLTKWLTEWPVLHF